MIKHLRFSIVAFMTVLFWISPGSASPQETSEEPQVKGTLDGVKIEALEIYANPKHNEFSFGVGYYPFDAFYDSYGFNGGYTYYYNDTYAWEILQASYVLSFQKSLVANLAQLGVQTATLVEKLQYTAGTHFVISHTYGKYVLLKNFLHYFRSSILIGPGFLHTSKRTSLTLDIGIRLIGYVNDRFSWMIDIRDLMALPFAQSGTNSGSFAQYLYFGLSLGVTF